MTPLCFHLLPDATAADLAWAIGASAPGAWIKVCKPEQVGLVQAAGLKCYFRPYLGGDDNGTASGKSWAETVIGAVQANGTHWPDAIGYRNEMSCTQANVTEYVNYRTRLQQAGYQGLTVLGSFGVGNPDWPEYALLASVAPDAIELHEYWDRTITGSARYWALRHIEAQARGLLSLSVPLFIGECGSDGIPAPGPVPAGQPKPLWIEDGTCRRDGWQSLSDYGCSGPKLSEQQQAANIAQYAAACAASVVAAFVFGDGGSNPQWVTYHTRGTAVEAAIRATQTGVPLVSTDDTVTLWARDALVQLGITVAAAPMAMLLAWAQAEGGVGHNNPLNTTLVMPNSTPWNHNAGYPVQAYPDLATGVTATIDTLTASPYAAIVADLRSGNTAGFAADVYASPWGTRQGIDVAAALAALGATPPAVQSDAPNLSKGTAVSVAPIDFRQLPGSYDCWVETLRRFFSRYGILLDEDTVFQAGKGYHRPTGGEAADFPTFRRALENLARANGVQVGVAASAYQHGQNYLQLIEIDTFSTLWATLDDANQANPWSVIIGENNADLNPAEAWQHYIGLLQDPSGSDVINVYDPASTWDGDAAQYTREQLQKAILDNFDPVIVGYACKIVPG